MAQLRAPTIATIIQLILSSLGIPLEAKNVLITAKGNAKIVCPNLIIPRMIWIFRITINLLAFAWAWIVNPMISGISASADDSVLVPTMKTLYFIPNNNDAWVKKEYVHIDPASLLAEPDPERHALNGKH